MTRLVTILNQANRDLHFEKKVIERRAEMAAQCECLAAWVEDRECVCGSKAIDVPLSTDNLKMAHSLIGEIEGCEKRLALVSKIERDDILCSVELGGNSRRRHHQNGVVYYEDDTGYHSAPVVTLPKTVLIAALKEERTKLMIELHKTGIVSVGRDNIRTVPR
jgi:hypothetical protein